MYEPVLTDEKLDLYNVYEVHKNYRILAMAVNVPLQVAEEICHILNNNVNIYNVNIYVETTRGLLQDDKTVIEADDVL